MQTAAHFPMKPRNVPMYLPSKDISSHLSFYSCRLKFFGFVIHCNYFITVTHYNFTDLTKTPTCSHARLSIINRVTILSGIWTLHIA